MYTDWKMEEVCCTACWESRVCSSVGDGGDLLNNNEHSMYIHA